MVVESSLALYYCISAGQEIPSLGLTGYVRALRVHSFHLRSARPSVVFWFCSSRSFKCRCGAHIFICPYNPRFASLFGCPRSPGDSSMAKGHDSSHNHVNTIRASHSDSFLDTAVFFIQFLAHDDTGPAFFKDFPHWHARPLFASSYLYPITVIVHRVVFIQTFRFYPAKNTLSTL